MTKKDYEAAATIVQEYVTAARHAIDEKRATRADVSGILSGVEDAFVKLFRDDNARFDEARFRRACVPGANVRARRSA